ncbi:hypothetical protein ACFFHC_06595 [Kytococcus schroeteri]|uniref:hypothetical protein n=1 Tax=Kytococcus schroeteri TaxID=138300 RepID=UPI0035EB7B7F
MWTGFVGGLWGRVEVPGLENLGVVSRPQLLEAGCSSASVGRAARDWAVLLPGVYWCTPSAEVLDLCRGGRRPGHAITWPEVPWEVRARAALLRWPAARLAGTSAGHADGWGPEPAGVSLLAPAGRAVHAAHGVDVRRERPGVRAPSRPADLRRTRPEDTLVDVVDRMPPEARSEVFTWLARALGHRVTRPDLLQDTLRRRRQVRHRRELTEALEDLARGTASHLEHRYMADVHRRHGLPPAHQQAPVASGVPGRGAFADVAYRGPGVLVELDGRLGHVGEGVLRDRRRDNANTLAGWATLRFGWHDVVGDPCAVARDVAQALAARGWRSTWRPCARC